ncbi:MAG: response regulator [Myxococcota bacterium]
MARRLRVLLVEGDPEMQGLLCAVLRDDGHDVAVVKGLATDASQPAPCADVLVCDTSARCTPEALVQWQSSNSGARLVVLTELGNAHRDRRDQRMGVVVLEKPFALQELRDAVSGCSVVTTEPRPGSR